LLELVAFGESEIVQLGPQCLNGVDGAFDLAGDVSCDVDDRHQVLVEDALVFDDVYRMD